jgi:hypothetical protein
MYFYILLITIYLLRLSVSFYSNVFHMRTNKLMYNYGTIEPTKYNESVRSDTALMQKKILQR